MALRATKLCCLLTTTVVLISNTSRIYELISQARDNIMKARYPVPIPDAEMLGGMLARIDIGEFDPDVHKPGYFKYAHFVV